MSMSLSSSAAAAAGLSMVLRCVLDVEASSCLKAALSRWMKVSRVLGRCWLPLMGRRALSLA